MIYYVDVRFEVEAESALQAENIVIREVNEIFDTDHTHGLGSLITAPYIISLVSEDSIEEFDSIDTVTEESIEAVNLFDLYKTVRNEVKL